MIKSPLYRQGAKGRILEKLLAIFSEDTTMFVDLFCGTGIMALNMASRCRYVFANDADNDIYNLFMILKDEVSREKLLELLVKTPYHESLFKHWVKNTEEDPIWKALRFLYLSRFGIYGTTSKMRFTTGIGKKSLLDNIETILIPGNIQWLSGHYNNVLTKINIRRKQNVTIYADPPYINSGFIYNNQSKKWTPEDLEDLIQYLVSHPHKFVISERDSKEIREMAEKHRLELTVIKEIQAIKKRHTEIVLTNYKPNTNKQVVLFG